MGSNNEKHFSHFGYPQYFQTQTYIEWYCSSYSSSDGKANFISAIIYITEEW